jgi:hypothetical protein
MAAASPASAWQPAPGLSPMPAILPVAVFGSDERIAIPAKYKALQDKVGVFYNMRRRTVCSAFCVAGDIIMTAGHCLLGTGTDRPARVADFTFARNFGVAREQSRVAGYDNGTAPQHVMLGTSHLSVLPPIEATRDWALVRLARPVCAKGWFSVRPLTIEEVLVESAAKRMFQIAYHRDFTPWRPAYSRPCSASKDFHSVDWKQIERDFANPEALILHTCDTGGASSGSPLLVDTPEGPQVIGINVGTYEQSKVLMQDGQVKKRLKAETIANTAVSSSAFASRLESFRQADILASQAQMRELQGLLAGRHLYSGPVDGNYDTVLKSSIETYEKVEGLTVTGLATVALLRRLGGGVAMQRPRDRDANPKLRAKGGKS